MEEVLQSTVVVTLTALVSMTVETAAESLLLTASVVDETSVRLTVTGAGVDEVGAATVEEAALDELAPARTSLQNLSVAGTTWSVKSVSDHGLGDMR